jgi:hypothetical protein
MRQLTITDAKREAAKAKIALSGGPGWGKTWTALRVARVLSPAGVVMGIDTEHESMKLYAPKPGQPPGPGEFEFKHTAWEPPYDPRELTEAILHYAKHVDVLIVDSLSHFWQGEGGTLDVASGKFTGWKEARPIQRALVEAIVRAPCHVIGCMRSKVEYAQTTGKDGKQKVERLGQADIQSDEMPYEFTVAAELDNQHQLTITKSRCRDLQLGRVYAPEHEVDMAATLLSWLQDAPEAATAQVPDPSTAAGMRAAQAEATAVRNGGQKPEGVEPGRAESDRTTPATPAAGEEPITLQHLLDTFQLNRNQLCLFLRKEAREDFGKLTVPDLDQLTPEQLHRAAAYLGAAKQTASTDAAAS